MQSSQIKSFLKKFSAGTYTDAEHQQFIEWTKTAPAEEVDAMLEEYNQVYNLPVPGKNTFPPVVDTNVISNIEAAIDQYELGKNKNQGGKIISWRRFYKLAAAVIILVAGTIAYFSFSNTKQSPG